MNLLFGLIIIIIIVLGFLYFKNQSGTVESFQVTETSHTPLNSDDMYRVTNTVLSAPTNFYKNIDQLTLPESVKNSFNEWIEKGFISPIKDQMLCGGCWAFAACGILADKLSIATNGRWRTPFGLSEQYLISCGENLGMKLYRGCEGGIPYFAMNALNIDGVPEDVNCRNCKNGKTVPTPTKIVNRVGVVNPNQRSLCDKIGRFGETEYTWWQNGCDGNASCGIVSASTCPCAQVVTEINSNAPQQSKYKTIGEAHSYTTHTEDNRLRAVDLWPSIPDSVKAQNVERIKKAIYYFGPIAVGFSISSDFYDYWTKATADNYYKYDGFSQMTGGHAVIIVGWKTVSDGTPVWIVKNNWGVTSGYGFDVMWTNPVTGEVEKQYPGGFWNHRMGFNDSYIESNASGCFPDLHVPQIERFLPNAGKDIPKDWYNTMTLRDVYTASQEAQIQEINPTEPASQEQKPPSGPALSPKALLSSNKFKVITLNPNNISIDSIKTFFTASTSRYMIGGTNAEMVNKVIEKMPVEKSDAVQFRTILKSLNVEDYIIIAGRDRTNMFFYVAGKSDNWKNVTPNVVKAATPTKLANDVYYKFLGLNNKDVIVELQDLQ